MKTKKIESRKDVLIDLSGSPLKRINRSVLFMRSISAIVLALLIFMGVSAQSYYYNDQNPEIKRHWVDLGLGLGLDYGGIAGVKLAFLPIQNISMFGSFGWEIYTYGWNTGITWHILPSNSRYTVRPNIKIMYGVHGATVVVGDKEEATRFNRIFTGWTPGLGVEFMFGPKKKNGLDLDINYPLRDVRYKSHVSEMDEYFGRKSFHLPVTISFGYHHEF